MNRLLARFAGPGWGLPVPLRLARPLEERVVAPTRPEELPSLLDWLDRVASAGDADLLAAGFVSYEAGVWLEGSRALFRPPDRTPLAAFGLFDLGRCPEAEPVRAGPPPPEPHHPIPHATSSLTRAEWRSAVEAIRGGIERGDVYQVNLTRRLSLPLPVSPGELARRLFADNPVPYALTLESDGWAVVSNSPELFLDADLRLGRVESAPIKGTAARGRTPEEDERSRDLLRASAKDGAEHVMIVDLVRNDLGKLAVPGGVEVGPLSALRSFTHLHHLESTVRARLRPGTRVSDLLLATLPGGSITGAPKRASLRFIRDLEPSPRGVYTGSAGFVRGNGTAVLNVAIRTAVVTPAAVDYHSGGGIVWDSDPGLEWAETETKSREFARAAGALAGPMAPGEGP